MGKKIFKVNSEKLCLSKPAWTESGYIISSYTPLGL